MGVCPYIGLSEGRVSATKIDSISFHHCVEDELIYEAVTRDTLSLKCETVKVICYKFNDHSLRGNSAVCSPPNHWINQVLQKERVIKSGCC